MSKDNEPWKGPVTPAEALAIIENMTDVDRRVHGPDRYTEPTATGAVEKIAAVIDRCRSYIRTRTAMDKVQAEKEAALERLRAQVGARALGEDDIADAMLKHVEGLAKVDAEIAAEDAIGDLHKGHTHLVRQPGGRGFEIPLEDERGNRLGGLVGNSTPPDLFDLDTQGPTPSIKIAVREPAPITSHQANRAAGFAQYETADAEDTVEDLTQEQRNEAVATIFGSDAPHDEESPF